MRNKRPSELRHLFRKDTSVDNTEVVTVGTPLHTVDGPLLSWKTTTCQSSMKFKLEVQSQNTVPITLSAFQQVGIGRPCYMCYSHSICEEKVRKRTILRQDRRANKHLVKGDRFNTIWLTSVGLRPDGGNSTPICSCDFSTCGIFLFPTEHYFNTPRLAHHISTCKNKGSFNYAV